MRNRKVLALKHCLRGRDFVENEAVPMYIMFLFEVPRISPALYFLSYTASLQTSVTDWLCEQLGIHYCAESLVFKDERRSRKYTTKETNAPPKLKPMLTVRKISPPRMFAQAGLLCTAKKFMTPKKVSTKKM